MINNAIKRLKERGGSSLQSIKKYVAANCKVDGEKVSPFIKKYLKSTVTSRILVQTKGKGASGSFKLPSLSYRPQRRPKSLNLRAASGANAKKVGSAKAKVVKKFAKGRPSGKKAAATASSSSPKQKKAAAVVKKSVAQKQNTHFKARKASKPGPTKKPKRAKATPKKAATSQKKKRAPSSDRVGFRQFWGRK